MRRKNTFHEEAAVAHLRRPLTAEDFSPSAVKKAVVKNAFTHPLTMIPLGLSFVGLSYLGLIGPEASVLAFTIFTGAMSASSWVFNFFIRGPKFAKAYVVRLREKRKRYNEERITVLSSECENTGFGEGKLATTALGGAYFELVQFLEKENVRNKGSSNAQMFFSLAEDTYGQGVSIIEQALGVYQALQTIDRKEIEKERREYERELKQFNTNGSSENVRNTKTSVLKTKIENCEKRLKLYDDRSEQLQELLAECERLKGALEIAYLELVDLVRRDGTVMFSKNKIGALSELERAVNAARKVEEKLRGFTDTTEEDEFYLREGRKSTK